jgi:chaperonin GroEL (HSP60 family)
MAVADITRVARELELIAASCAGPDGSFKLLLHGVDDMVITTNSRRLMEHGQLLSTSPYAQVVLELTRQQFVQYGDGGLFALQFASGLVRRARESGLHHYHASAAFSTAVVSSMRHLCGFPKKCLS